MIGKTACNMAVEYLAVIFFSFGHNVTKLGEIEKLMCFH